MGNDIKSEIKRICRVATEKLRLSEIEKEDREIVLESLSMVKDLVKQGDFESKELRNNVKALAVLIKDEVVMEELVGRLGLIIGDMTDDPRNTNSDEESASMYAFTQYIMLQNNLLGVIQLGINITTPSCGKIYSELEEKAEALLIAGMNGYSIKDISEIINSFNQSMSSLILISSSTSSKSSSADYINKLMGNILDKAREVSNDDTFTAVSGIVKIHKDRIATDNPTIVSNSIAELEELYKSVCMLAMKDNY